MSSPLYADPKLDEFKTESPLLAFSEYDTCGPYLIAKGFRPSLKHLTRYLEAMENKEGWRLLQILEADTGVPTLVFRSRNRMDTPISLGWATDDSTGRLTEITVHYNGEDVRLVPDYRDGDIFVVEYLNNDSQTVVRSPVERWPQWAQELAGYRPGDPDASAAEAMEKTEQAEAMDWTITVKGLNSEAVPWNRAQWHGKPEDLMDRLRLGDRTTAQKFLTNEEHYVSMSEFYRKASVASVLRLINHFDAWDEVSLAEIISDDELYRAIGHVNTKARHYCKPEVTSGDPILPAIVQNPADVLERRAEQVADELGIDVCRESFAIAREHLDDVIDPCYAFLDDQKEEAARYVIERVYPNAEFREGIVHEFKKRFLNPESTPLPPHHRLDAQLQFVIGGDIDIVVIRNYLASFMTMKENKIKFESGTPEPIPAAVYWSPEHGNFYNIHTHAGMGRGFYNAWRHRANEFKRDPRIVRVVTADGLGFPPDGTPLADPVNPKHYDGRACADIGERLSANGYQILKYCWRLGKKDDPCQELGKALWYLDSEMAFIGTKGVPNRVQTNFRGLKDPSGFLQDRLSDQPQFTKSVAAALWNGYDARDLDILKMFIAEHKTTLDCGHGLAI